MDPLRAGDELDLCAEGSHRADLLGGEGVGADDPQPVALDRAHERERAAGAAARVLDDRVAGPQSPRASAPSTIASAMRSLYEPVGLCDSSFTHTSAIPGSTSRERRTIGRVADGVQDGRPARRGGRTLSFMASPSEWRVSTGRAHRSRVRCDGTPRPRTSPAPWGCGR